MFAVCGAAPYLFAIVRGHRPPYATYIGWLLIGATAFFLHWNAIPEGHDRWSALLPAAYIVIPASYLLILLLYRAPITFSRRDTISIVGVVVTWVIWVAAQNAGERALAVSLMALIMTDFFASWPILDDARRGYESKNANRASWALSAISAFLGVLAVSEAASLEITYPLYLLSLMATIFAFSLAKQHPRESE